MKTICLIVLFLPLCCMAEETKHIQHIENVAEAMKEFSGMQEMKEVIARYRELETKMVNLEALDVLLIYMDQEKVPEAKRVSLVDIFRSKIVPKGFQIKTEKLKIIIAKYYAEAKKEKDK